MLQSATPATQNDMSTSSDTSKKTRLCNFSHRHGNFEAMTVADGRLRTVATACGRWRTPEAGSREHGSTPRPPNVKREPFATHSGINFLHLMTTRNRFWLSDIGSERKAYQAYQDLPVISSMLLYAFVTIPNQAIFILDEIHRKQLKHGVPGPLTTKRYAQPKHKLYKMMFQVPHTYPAGAYKMLLVFMFFDWKAECTYGSDTPEAFCRLHQLDF